jgi:hypothetical protein
MTAGADLRLLRTAVFTVVCVTLSAAGHSLTGGGRIPLWSLGVACVVVFVVAAPLAGRERSLPGIAALLAAGQLALHTLFSCGGATVRASGAAASRTVHGGGHAGADVRELAARLLCNEQSAGAISEARARQVVSDAGLVPSRLGSHAGTSGHGHLGDSAAQHHAHHAGAGQGGGGAASAVESPLECLRSAADAALSLVDGPMLAAHLLAALVLGWVLRRGEAALWELVRISARSARSATIHVRALGTALAYVRAVGNQSLPQLPARTVRVGDAGDQREPQSVLLDHSVQRRGPPAGTRQETFALAA